VIPWRVRVAAMEQRTIVASRLRSRLGKDPWSTDDAAETDRNVLEAAEDATTV
jgi:hypothetical protein